jgi:hypothetical protein
VLRFATELSGRLAGVVAKQGKLLSLANTKAAAKRDTLA